MELGFDLDGATLRILYFKYKEYILPSIVLIIAFLIFIFFSYPEIQNYSTEETSLASSNQTLDTLNSNLNIVNNLNSNDLDNDFTTVIHALPTEKNFAGILTSISDAELKSAVTLGNYSFQLGNLKQKLSDDTTTELTLTILGGAPQTQNFILALKNELPLNNVKSINVNSITSSNLNVIFYYQPETKSIFNPEVPLVNLTNDDLKTIRNLNVFTTNFYFGNNLVSTSSASAL